MSSDLSAGTHISDDGEYSELLTLPDIFSEKTENSQVYVYAYRSFINIPFGKASRIHVAELLTLPYPNSLLDSVVEEKSRTLQDDLYQVFVGVDPCYSVAR